MILRICACGQKAAPKRTKCNTCRNRVKRLRNTKNDKCYRCGSDKSPDKKYCSECLINIAKEVKAANLRRKKLVFEHYGLKCGCCDESLLELLTIDHIDGGGAKHRRELNIQGGSRFYKWLLKENFPTGFQTLCFNCNLGKGLYGICPHQRVTHSPLTIV